LGVDISKFTEAFEAANGDAHELAGNILHRKGIYKKQLFAGMETALTEMTRKNFEDQAAVDHLTTKEECQLQVQDIGLRVARVTYSKVQPKEMQILRDAQ